MRRLKIAASLLMVSSFLTANPVLAQGSLSHDLRRQTVEEIPNPTENGAIQLAQNSGSGQVRVVYHEGTDDRSRIFINKLRQGGVIDNLAKGISNSYYLPRDLTISFQNCGESNAYYNSVSYEVIMCSELFWDARDLFESRNVAEQTIFFDSNNELAVGVLVFFLFHELGHAMIHILDLPVLGREEDVVDDIATLNLLKDEIDEDNKKRLIASISLYFMLISDLTKEETPDYWAEHSLDRQRMYNILCLFYGSNPEEFPGIAEALESRAKQCPREYENKRRNWTRLLDPHRRNRSSSNNGSTDTNSGQGSSGSGSNRVW